MARLFTYGKLKRVATQPGTNHLPGTYFTAYGVQYGAGAFNNTTDNIEPGEVVEIVKTSDKGYSVKRATADITAETAAIVLRDIMGVRAIEEGVFEEYVPGQPMTVVPATTPHGWAVSVSVVDGQTPAAGGTVYVGLGTGGTVLGGIYAAEQGAGGVDTVELTNWTFAGEKYAPTNSDSYAAVIQRF